MNAFVAVTDNEWFRHLRSLSVVDEVNFWRPSGGGFQALRPGEVLPWAATRLSQDPR